VRKCCRRPADRSITSHIPLIIVEDDDDRSAPSIVLRSACNASNVSRGLSVIVSCAAHGSVI